MVQKLASLLQIALLFMGANHSISVTAHLINRDRKVPHLGLWGESSSYIRHRRHIFDSSKYGIYVVRILVSVANYKVSPHFFIYHILINAIRLFSEAVRFAVNVFLRNDGLTLYSLHAVNIISSKSLLTNWEKGTKHWAVASTIYFLMLIVQTSA